MRISEAIQQSIDVKQLILDDPSMIERIRKVTQICIDAFRNGNKVLFCGNGGSAADAQHLAAEFSGRFYYDRPPLPSEALHVNTSYLTAVANDYSYDEVYARLIKGIGKKGDVLFGISTSGNSANILRAFDEARSLGIITVAMTGYTGGKIAACCEYLLNMPSGDTPRIQESHIMIGHIICELVEAELFPKKA